MIRAAWVIPVIAMFGCAHKPEAKVETPVARPSAAATVTPTPGSCTSNSDCAGGQLCVNNRCEAASESSQCQSMRVSFPFNSSELSAADRSSLERGADCIKADHSLHVTIEGNADERGTEEYNLALGDRRANAVAKYLENLGASQGQLKTVSYGKENPVCNEHDEACWSQNRRADLKLADRRR
jgi:peptidoglycan-associated lipoprotein